MAERRGAALGPLTLEVLTGLAFLIGLAALRFAPGGELATNPESAS